MTSAVLSRAMFVTVPAGPGFDVIWNHIFEAWTELNVFKHIIMYVILLFVIFYSFFGIDFPKASK